MYERSSALTVGGGSQSRIRIAPPWGQTPSELILLYFTVTQGSGLVVGSVDIDQALSSLGGLTIPAPMRSFMLNLPSVGTVVCSPQPFRVQEYVYLDFSQGGAEAYLTYVWQRLAPSLNLDNAANAERGSQSLMDITKGTPIWPQYPELKLAGQVNQPTPLKITGPTNKPIE